ncbi:MAG: 23S rRNA (adenine(2503)-C(2))-methyltransferase RlmN [Bacteroidales bacterium]|nr:23S rRNA (adenine(2503)-C(2))-methyltransferase RlmN [Bacteroidales bacterium]
MVTLFGQTLSQLQELCLSEGFPKFTAKQLCDWMYHKRVNDFDSMTNLSLKIRARLNEIAVVSRYEPVDCQVSVDGTKKYLFGIHNSEFRIHNYIESVYIPDGDRATLCVSCQMGCKMGCRFCVTGKQGFHGSLTTSEILNQIFSIPESGQLTNVVFMGMGEPLDNYDAIKQTLEVLTSDWGLGWSPHRLTVSTVGITPMLKRLIEETQCHIAVSLHNPFPDERAEMMPMQKMYPIAEIISLLKKYNWYGQRRISFEYTMFRGINDDINHASELARLLRGLHCRVNLIRFHSSPDTPYRTSEERTMTAFEDYLNNHGIICTIRASRGEDIMAACGLLAGKGAKQ